MHWNILGTWFPRCAKTGPHIFRYREQDVPREESAYSRRTCHHRHNSAVIFPIPCVSPLKQVRSFDYVLDGTMRRSRNQYDSLLSRHPDPLRGSGYASCYFVNEIWHALTSKTSKPGEKVTTTEAGVSKKSFFGMNELHICLPVFDQTIPVRGPACVPIRATSVGSQVDSSRPEGG